MWLSPAGKVRQLKSIISSFQGFGMVEDAAVDWVERLTEQVENKA